MSWGSDHKTDATKKKKKKKSNGSIRSIFMHADSHDWFLMILGVLGCFGDGFTGPTVLFISSRLMNNIGGASFTMNIPAFVHNSNEVLLFNIPHSLLPTNTLHNLDLIYC